MIDPQVLRLEPDGRTSTPPNPETAPQAPPRHILLVEDNDDARETLQTLLGLFGHHVDVAHDGPAGVAKAEVVRPQVALIDIGLPGMDGYEVARKPREVLGNDVFLVALTGFGQPEDRERAERAGCNAHLVKPVDIQELTRLLAALPARTC
jgi:CheY-like chemotaxis protein